METPIPPPQLDGELRLDDETRRERAEDFGHLVHHLPEADLMPASADDLAKTIQWSAQRGRTFAAHGRRHSTFGRAQTQGGIVADMSTLRHIAAVADDRVVVGAGATWSDVLQATLAHGRTPPVLTSTSISPSAAPLSSAASAARPRRTAYRATT